jgi:hypothetical protein
LFSVFSDVSSFTFCLTLQSYGVLWGAARDMNVFTFACCDKGHKLRQKWGEA